MKYFVFEDDELIGGCEETMYVFEHTKRKNKYDSINTLEEFAVQCIFIERRDTHWLWYKGKNVIEMTMEEFEERIRTELKMISEEECTKVRNRYSPYIKPIEFPRNGIRCAYAYEPDWNDVFFVMETEESYFALYWFTGA
ncbi:DUF2262 domain-containing protein [Bacillus pseudomycoides]|uniref:hypothetical protein n=1 Tax=Bacillus pseudomycoides TaxID=64104 RepID=UPI000BF6212E|nr:hypothetical protein [Bacillus pseudomycoides]PEP71831.1 hypothetical protein CN584_29745 [Bacillus pseudomycoides]PGF05749.1 hypothetical protein COM59_28265 [Bacillus pseudomycoides]